MAGRGQRARRLAVCAVVGIGLGLFGYVGLIQSGLVRSPLAPILRGDLDLARSIRPGVRVLFVGNSFTSDNSLAALVQQLAAADPGAPRLITIQYARGGWSLKGASQDESLARLVREIDWDVVVLQEQSQLLSFDASERLRESYPYARVLHGTIAASGARTLLFMTWGYEAGDRDNRASDTYGAMQARLRAGYTDLGKRLSVPVAPVGLAWAEVMWRDPSIDLWARDGKHPSLRGSYLAACVFYRFISRRDPAGSDFTAGVPRRQARILQRAAISAG